MANRIFAGFAATHDVGTLSILLTSYLMEATIMDRREFVKILSALATPTVLPTKGFAGEFSSAEGASSAELLVLTEDTFDREGFPRIGVVTVGGAGGTELTSTYGKLPHLRRSVTIDFNLPSLVAVAADRKLLIGESNAIRQSDAEVRRFLHVRKAKAKIREAISDLDLAFVVTRIDEAKNSVIAHLVFEVLREKKTLFISAPIAVFEPAGGKITFEQLYRGIASPLFEPGLVTLDLEDIQDVISSGCLLALGYGGGSGLNAAESAALAAISHPLLGMQRLRCASKILVSIEAPPGKFMRFGDINIILKTIRYAIADADVGHEQSITFGATYKEKFADEFEVTILAGGVLAEKIY